jgi:hypothetical protein
MDSGRPVTAFDPGGLRKFGRSMQRSGPALFIGRSLGIAAALAFLWLVVETILAPYGIYAIAAAVLVGGLIGRFVGGWVALRIMLFLKR